MLSSYKKIMHLILKQNMLCFYVAAGGFILGAILQALVAKLDSEATTFYISTMMVLMSWIIFSIVNALMFSTNFNLAVGMGMTRTDYIWSSIMGNLTIGFGMVFVIKIACLAESFLIKIYSNIPHEEGVELFVSRWEIFILPVAVSVLQLFTGAMMFKFRNSFWYVYLVCMVIGMGTTRLGHYVAENPDSKFVKTLEPAVVAMAGWGEATWLCILFVVLAAIAFVSYSLVKKQAVTS